MHLWKECSMHERMWLIFLTVSYVLLYGFGQINLLTTATALMGSICMFLGAKAKISNFYSGAIYTLLYAWQCYLFDFKLVLYLHLIFHFPLQFVGWYFWRKNRVCMPAMQEDVLVRQLFPHGWVAVLLSLILASTFFAQIVFSMGEGKPELDILAFVFSIAAQLLMIGRFIESWVAWLCLNVFNVGLWTYTAITVTPTYSIAYMWLIFMGNCSYGCYRWVQIGKKQTQLYAGPYCKLPLNKI